MERCPVCRKILPMKKNNTGSLDWHIAGHLFLLKDFTALYRYSKHAATVFFLADLLILFMVVCCLSAIVRDKI